MAGFPTLKGSWPWPCIGSYCIPSCITHRPTYRPNFIEIKETFCERTDGRTDGHLRSALLGRLCRRVDLIRTKCDKWQRIWQHINKKYCSPLTESSFFPTTCFAIKDAIDSKVTGSVAASIINLRHLWIIHLYTRNIHHQRHFLFTSPRVRSATFNIIQIMHACKQKWF